MKDFLEKADYKYSLQKMASLRKCFVICLLFLFVAACTAPVYIEKKASSQSIENDKKKVAELKSIPSDAEYLHYGLSMLAATPERPPDHEQAGLAFEMLLKEHPDSKWRESAMAMIKILHDLLDCREKEKENRALRAKHDQDKMNLMAEIEKLTKTNSALNEKMQSEVAKLVQENERLKKDIELLKNLEIKLDKRERLLR